MLRVIEDLRDISIHSNVEILLRNIRGEVIDKRIGHNILTTTGKNWLSKLISWQTISSTDIPFTNRRLRWMGLGIGSQLEVATIASLVQPVTYDGINYLAKLDSPAEFPTSTSVRVKKIFGVNEVSLVGNPVILTEVALFADVIPANAGGTEDVGYSAATDPTLNPAVGTNAPVAYKAFEPITKTLDITLEVRWDFRF